MLSQCPTQQRLRTSSWREKLGFDLARSSQVSQLVERWEALLFNSLRWMSAFVVAAASPCDAFCVQESGAALVFEKHAGFEERVAKHALSGVDVWWAPRATMILG